MSEDHSQEEKDRFMKVALDVVDARAKRAVRACYESLLDNGYQADNLIETLQMDLLWQRVGESITEDMKVEPSMVYALKNGLLDSEKQYTDELLKLIRRHVDELISTIRN